MDAQSREAVTARCHCGAVSVTLATAPTEITECNCSLCRSYGVLWAYCEASDIVIAAAPTHSYAWNGRHVDFHRCAKCGCVTHWLPRAAGRTRRGVNARLLPPEIVARARLRHLDGANTKEYLD